MGGQNHHMCSGCIRHTTLLSKTYSLAEAEMLHANAVLEDTMVAELYGSFDHARHFAPQINRHLKISASYLVETRDIAEEVIRLMNVIPYQNGEALRSIDFQVYRDALEQNGIDMSHEAAWAAVVHAFQTGGVGGALGMFIHDLDELYKLTQDVISAIAEAQKLASETNTLIDMFERNEGAFKTRFARLITRYRSSSLRFSYAALVTTEAHLMTNDYKSLQAAA